mgnify:CR=1 FL=1
MAMAPEVPRTPDDAQVPGSDMEPVADDAIEEGMNDFLGDMFNQDPPSEEAGEPEEGIEDEERESIEEESTTEDRIPEKVEESPVQSSKEDDEAGEAEVQGSPEDSIKNLEDGLDSSFRTITGQPSQSPQVPAAEVSEPVAREASQAATEVPQQTSEEADVEDLVVPGFSRLTSEDVEKLENNPEEMYATMMSAAAQQAVDVIMGHLATNTPQNYQDTSNIDEAVAKALQVREERANYYVGLVNLYQQKYPRHTNVMELVGKITQEVSAAQPDRAPHHLLQEVSETVDSLLAGVQENTPTRRGRPADTIGTKPGIRSRSSANGRTSNEDEVAELLDF